MKKILILSLACDLPPYDQMVKTAEETWDSIDHPQCETVYYFSNREKQSSGKYLYLPIQESLYTMGHKLLGAFEWALAYKDFDYIARPHSCIYVDKKQLAGYINELPDKNVFAGPLVDQTPKWLWGGLGFIFSRDVVQKIVEGREKWDHRKMEDTAVSALAIELGIPFTHGAGCSIDKYGNSWLCLSYGPTRSKSFTFTDFSEVPKNSNQFYYRVKQDYDRKQDKYIMEQLFKHLQ
jgi:hypothetical protein